MSELANLPSPIIREQLHSLFANTPGKVFDYVDVESLPFFRSAKQQDISTEMFKALKRWQDEWVVNGTPAQRANNYAIELEIDTVIKKAEASGMFN